MNDRYYVGIDVGTGSARCGIFDARGRMLSASSHPIEMWRPLPDFVEQSSEDIWRACCRATKEAMQKSGIHSDQVDGIGFDATCSLVVLDEFGRPLSVSSGKKSERNVIVWMDHRAVAQAKRINQTQHRVLRYVGSVMSPEMQTPKLLWLKENLPEVWNKAAHFFDLPDFLTYRATGDTTRSLCSVVCKWTYLGHRGVDGIGWDASYFEAIGLEDLANEKFRRIGTRIRHMGESLGNGLSKKAAADLGLRIGTAVGVSAIDAHAGGIGMLGSRIGKEMLSPNALGKRLALIGGTSSCDMAVSPVPRFIKGIWGPYFSAMIPGMWLTEGGQSATGALIDHIIHSHPAAKELMRKATNSGKTVYQLLNAHLELLSKSEEVSHLGELTKELHILPDFHGNRSPRANPTLRGTISGLTLSTTEDDLARQYLAAIQAIAYGARHILEVMKRKGYEISTILVCGGGAKNPIFLREHADITGCKLVLPKEPEAVLLGSAMLGAVAAKRFRSVIAAMGEMSAVGEIFRPARGRVAAYHERKYQVFQRMHSDYLAYRRIMTP